MNEGELRIGDAERTATVELLQQHAAEGRLSNEEFNDRMSRALTARYQSELDDLLVDLPQLGFPTGFTAGSAAEESQWGGSWQSPPKDGEQWPLLPPANDASSTAATASNETANLPAPYTGGVSNLPGRRMSSTGAIWAIMVVFFIIAISSGSGGWYLAWIAMMFLGPISAMVRRRRAVGRGDDDPALGPGPDPYGRRGPRGPWQQR